MAGIDGNSVTQKRIGKLVAVVWLLAAAFAMQLVSSAQGLSLRGSGQQSAGDVSVPNRAAPDPVLSARALRAVPATDLRFTADRSDAKPLPVGTDTPVLPWRFASGVRICAFLSACRSAAAVRVDAVSHHIRVRAPPSGVLA